MSNSFDTLVVSITDTSRYFQQQAQKQVNVALTLRNWLIGAYLFEYEQHGQDRAEYGEKLYKNLAKKLQAQGIKGLSFTNLHLCKQFYVAYPQIVQSVTEQLALADNQGKSIAYILSATQTAPQIGQAVADQLSTDSRRLVNHLSFTHIIELLKANSSLKRFFYESQAIQNNWSVRELQRAMNSMLFERTGLSTDKVAVVQKHAQGTGLTAEDVFRNPYMLEFLGLSEKTEYSEFDLEYLIHLPSEDELQKFIQQEHINVD
jgi:hypothetical protein